MLDSFTGLNELRACAMFRQRCSAAIQVVQVNYHVSKYTEIIKDLRSEIQELKAELPRLYGVRKEETHKNMNFTVGRLLYGRAPLLHMEAW